MKILLIEDEVKLAQAIQKGLESQHFVVRVVYDGKDGYYLAKSEPFDVIIVDRLLPSMDGVTICQTLRQEKVMTPLLMLTALGQVGDKVHGLDAGADDYMVKPFSFEELFSRLRALVRRAVGRETNLLCVADLTLDPTSIEVRRGGIRISLSSKEFALLEYLLRNMNKTVTKDSIVRDVWEYDTDILPNTIEVHMKNLRGKIDTPFSRKLITTVRGFGYTIREE